MPTKLKETLAFDEDILDAIKDRGIDTIDVSWGHMFAWAAFYVHINVVGRSLIKMVVEGNLSDYVYLDLLRKYILSFLIY